MSERIAAFRAMLERGQDSALLRFSLGNEYVAAGDFAAAVPELRLAVEQDPGYSAAWKLLGKALTEIGEVSGAIAAYEQGVDTATAKGDRQAAREMSVFLKRLRNKEGAG